MLTSRKTAALWILTGILLLCAIWLTFGLNSRGLWVDEGWSIIAAGKPNLAEVTSMVADDVHPPLYFYLLHIWQAFTGQTVFTLRFFTVLTTLISAAVIYRMGKALFGQQTGILAALLFVLHDLVLVLGQETRQYSQGQLLAALTIWMYWRFWRRPSRSNGIALCLAGAALLWTHYWGGFVLLALALHALITSHRNIVPYAVAFSVVGLLFAPWLPVLYTQITDGIPQGIGHALPASRMGYEILAYQLLGIPEVLWGLLALVGSMNLASRRWQPSSASILPALIVVVTIILSVLIDLFYPTLSFRTLSVILPALLVLIAHSVNALRGIGQHVMIFIIIVLSISLTAAGPPTRLPWKQVAEYVTTHSGPDDTVLIETWFDSYAFMYYLQHRDSGITYLGTELERRKGASEDFEAHLHEHTDNYDGIWVVYFSSEYDLSPVLSAAGFNRTAVITWETELSPIDLWRYDRVPNSPSIAVYDEILQLDSYTLYTQKNGITLNLLWSALKQPAYNYTISTFLLDTNGVLVTQHDSYPLDNHSPTLSWITGNHYFDGRFLPIEGVARGVYHVGLKVYTFVDDRYEEIEIVAPEPCETPCEFIILDQVEIR
jgi:uncharacterized membrane protein